MSIRLCSRASCLQMPSDPSAQTLRGSPALVGLLLQRSLLWHTPANGPTHIPSLWLPNRAMSRYKPTTIISSCSPSDWLANAKFAAPKLQRVAQHTNHVTMDCTGYLCPRHTGAHGCSQHVMYYGSNLFAGGATYVAAVDMQARRSVPKADGLL